MGPCWPAPAFMIRTREQRRHGIRLLNLRVDVWLILLVLASSVLALLCLSPNNLSLQVEEGPPVEAFITPDEELPAEQALPPRRAPCSLSDVQCAELLCSRRNEPLSLCFSAQI